MKIDLAVKNNLQRNYKGCLRIQQWQKMTYQRSSIKIFDFALHTYELHQLFVIFI
jgi:hypothetical protein